MHKRDKKTAKKALFWAALFPIEIRTLSPIISLKCADFLVLTPACGCAGAHPGGRRELWVLGSVWFPTRERKADEIVRA